MRRLLPALLILVVAAPAWGHPMPNTAVALRLHREAIDAELVLPIGELALGWEKPLPTDPVATVRQYGEELKDYVRAHVRPVAPDGRPWTVTVLEVSPVVEQQPDVRVALALTPPPGAPADRLTFRYDVIFHHLLTHMAVVTLADDWRNGVMADAPVLLGTMRDTNAAIAIDRSGESWLRGFAAMFRLGARHIAKGTDHLLFLLALILPAPLVAKGWRWGGYAGSKMALRRIVKVVTAFTLGHSVTLVIGALGWARLPGAVVESAIASRSWSRPSTHWSPSSEAGRCSSRAASGWCTAWRSRRHSRTSGSTRGRWSQACWASTSGSKPSSFWSSCRGCRGSYCWLARERMDRSVSPGPLSPGSPPPRG